MRSRMHCCSNARRKSSETSFIDSSIRSATRGRRRRRTASRGGCRPRAGTASPRINRSLAMNASLSRFAWIALAIAVTTVSATTQAQPAVRVASKIDTEGSLLGNMIIEVLNANGIKTENKVQLGTTKIVRGAITAGEIDIYPEYTGNGAFFFADETNSAWKNAKAGYERVKALDFEK